MIGCLLVILSLGFPRLVILLLEFANNNYISSAFTEKIWPILGFFFAPLTTLAAAWSMHAYGGIKDAGLIAVIVAVILDFGLLGSAARSARKRKG